MKVLIVTRDPRGSPVKKTVTGEWVRVGRHASSEIYLADPRIALAQGMLVWRDGLVYIEGEMGVSSKSTTRKSVRSMRLKRGEPLEVGPYRIELIDTPAGYDGAVSVELAHPLEVAPGLANRTSQLTLASLGLTKRWAAWTWGVAVLLLFLLLPAGRVLHLPWTPATEAIGTTDHLWNPGKIMLAHEPIENKCEACHEVAFVHVRDRACLECHAKIGQHVPADMHPAALFEGARCATCHREHKGVKTTHRDDDRFCVACHRDIRSKVAAAKSKNVVDFARDHPAFAAKFAQASGLKFTHEKHLDPKGVKSPTKGRVHLECSNCHKPDASGRSFEPISMAKRCQECHTMQFEPAVTAREVPHGKPADAVAVIDDFYANLALQGTPDSFQKAFGVPGQGLLRRVSSPSPEERQDALALATRKAKRVEADLFEVRVCKQCHEVSRTTPPAQATSTPAKPPSTPAGGPQLVGAIDKPGAQFEIAPVKISPRRMPHALFDHKAHAQTKCADCHDVARAKRISDVPMPKIEKCRECHGGSKPVEGKITSNCLMCHAFHHNDMPWDPQFVPKARARVAESGVLAR